MQKYGPLQRRNAFVNFSSSFDIKEVAQNETQLICTNRFEFRSIIDKNAFSEILNVLKFLQVVYLQRRVSWFRKIFNPLDCELGCPILANKSMHIHQFEEF